MKCPKCHHPNPDGVKFCVECGQKLEAVCPKCGTTNSPEHKFCGECGQPLVDSAPSETAPPVQPADPAPLPTAFDGEHYQIREPLGEGGKKRVYLAHDTVIDRDVALSLLKTEGLDEASRIRLTREAQAMGKLGSHQNIVTIHDLGEENGQPYIVTELMAGDVAGLIAEADDHRLPIEQAIDIAASVCRGLEHAHAKGIIHRDVKPSNVYLTADGVVKIGDFGLALVDDFTRLTMTDHIVGTMSYLPPELASGGEVTARSDLYSLGVMIYEMVSGTLPFVGDTPEAVIGQHLKTPPVSPSWHNADVPPSLEALILQLLEKNPNSRPASASDVISTLKSVEAGQVSAEPETGTSADISPIYRRVFVGREAELKQLKDAFDRACSGNGSLAMVVGEPGIGKTALCEELKTYAGIRGGQTLVGHCYEEGSISFAYQAFVEAMRSYVLERDPDDLREVFGSGAMHVGRIVSEIRDRLRIGLPEPASPEEDRYRLMQSVSEFLSHAADMQPMLMVLEDLHDADKETLDMLAFAARSLSGARILIVGNYRDVEVDRAHPLSKALAELRRAADYNRVLLRGLNADEVQRMLAAITGQDVPWGIAEDVYRSTEGNPLFVQEVIRHLVEEGQIKREGGQWQGLRHSEVTKRIPEGLRDVIGKRLSSLSAGCNRSLARASVIGREFGLRILQSIADTPEDALHGALEEAKATHVVEEHESLGATVRYRFTHAFFRQTLYEEMIAPERIKIHQQVASALERVYEDRVEEHAVELAEHFSHSSDQADLAKAVRYGELAAQGAESVFAFGEAVRLLEQTLKVQEVLDPENKEKRCDLLLAMCQALLSAGEYQRIFDVEAPAALALAEEIGDSERAGLVCREALVALSHTNAGTSYASPEHEKWVERADRFAEPDAWSRPMVDMWLGSMKVDKAGTTGDSKLHAEGISLLSRSLESVRLLNIPRLLWVAAFHYSPRAMGPLHNRNRLRLAEELMQTSRSGLDPTMLSVGLLFAGHGFLEAGLREPAEEAWHEHQSLALPFEPAYYVMNSLQISGNLAYLDGRLEDGAKISESLRERGEELGHPEPAGILAGRFATRTLLHLGRAEEALQLQLEPDAPRILCLAHLGRAGDVSEILEQEFLTLPDAGSSEDVIRPPLCIAALEAAVMIGHRRAADLLLRRFGDNDIKTTGTTWLTCPARHLGAAEALLDRPDRARQHYSNAQSIASDMRFRPELALTRFQMAELLFEHYPGERDGALEHLDFALEEFKEMKMHPYIEKAQALKDGL